VLALAAVRSAKNLMFSSVFEQTKLEICAQSTSISGSVTQHIITFDSQQESIWLDYRIPVQPSTHTDMGSNTVCVALPVSLLLIQVKQHIHPVIHYSLLRTHKYH